MNSRAQKNWKSTLKWLCYASVLLLAVVLESLPGFLAVGGAKPLFILPVCLAVAIEEDEFKSALFGAVGGLIWDWNAGRVAGLLAIAVLALCFLFSVLVQLYLRIGLKNFTLVVAISSWCVLSVDFLFFYLMQGYAKPSVHYVQVVLLTVLLTVVLSPASLWLVRKIAARFAPD